MIADESHPKTSVVYFKVLVKPLVNLIWVAGFVFLLGSRRRALARRARAAAARHAARACARVTRSSLVLGVAVAAVVVLVALPFLREPTPTTTGSTRRPPTSRSGSRSSRSATARSRR